MGLLLWVIDRYVVLCGLDPFINGPSGSVEIGGYQVPI